MVLASVSDLAFCVSFDAQRGVDGTVWKMGVPTIMAEERIVSQAA